MVKSSNMIDRGRKKTRESRKINKYPRFLSPNLLIEPYKINASEPIFSPISKSFTKNRMLT